MLVDYLSKGVAKQRLPHPSTHFSVLYRQLGFRCNQPGGYTGQVKVLGGGVSHPFKFYLRDSKTFFVIPVTGMFRNLVKKIAYREFGRVCARSSAMVMLASIETTFWQNCADV